MAKSLVDILGWESRTAGVQDPAGGVPDAPLPGGLFTLTTPVQGNVSSYLKSTGVRQTGTIKGYESPSTPAPKVGTVQQPVTLIHGAMHHTHGAILLRQLKDENDRVQKMAEAELNTQTVALRQRYVNLRKAAVYSMLGLGHIYFADQELLGSSAGATVDVDFAPVSSNADLGAWDTAGTDIGAQIEAVKIAYAQDTGLQIRHCIYGANILGYLSTNTILSNLINGNPAFSQALGMNQAPAGFLGMQWWPASQQWFETSTAGTFASFFGDDTITMIPEPSPAWYELQEGTYPVPTSLGGVSNDASGSLGDFAEVSGMFAYATISDDPPGVKQIVGDCFLPIAKVTGSIRIVRDVTQAAT